MSNILQPLLGIADLDRPLCRARGQVITNHTFLADCHALAQCLPGAGYVINTCADRYRFTVGLAAALLRRQVTLLPASLAPAPMLELGQRYPGCYLLHDEASAIEGLDSFRYTDAFTAHGAAPSSPPAMPAFHPQQPAVVLFTSGSTGDPEPHPRNWGTLVASSRAAGRCLGLSALSGASILGTVPHQHSYGLESITMLALQFGLSFDPVRPLLPEDILGRLAQLPAPRILVTTPVHLRSLMHHAAVPPPVDCIVCATAPLAPSLAQLAEDRFAAPLFEIYGCTEVGQIALRRTVETSTWTCLEGITLRERDGEVHAAGPAAASDTPLNDVIELMGENQFELHGRKSDLVNIAGKRSSLSFLNFQLNAIEGVEDGVFVAPADSEGVTRLTAYVVAPGLVAGDILAALRRVVDPVFLPRPLHFVQVLPRNALGKLTSQALSTMDHASGER